MRTTRQFLIVMTILTAWPSAHVSAQAVVRGPHGGAAARGPNGAAVRTPSGAAAVRTPSGAAAVRSPTGAVATRPAYGARTSRAYYYGGHRYYGVYARPFVYPPGYAYRRWAVGAALPAVFLASSYYYTGYAAMGLPPPPAGRQWIRYGPDLLLVDLATGRVVHAAYGVFQ